MQHQVSLGLMRDIYWRFGLGRVHQSERTVTLWTLPICGAPICLWVGAMILAGCSNCLMGVGITLPANISVDTLHTKRLPSASPFDEIYPVCLERTSVSECTGSTSLETLSGSRVWHWYAYFDFGLFASFANWKYQEIGCKFTFELFNR